MGFHIDEHATVSEMKRLLSQPAQSYEDSKDNARKQEVPAGAVPSLLPRTGESEGAIRQAVVSTILAALNGVSDNSYVKVLAYGDSHVVSFTEEQLKSHPPGTDKQALHSSIHIVVNTTP